VATPEDEFLTTLEAFTSGDVSIEDLTLAAAALGPADLGDGGVDPEQVYANAEDRPIDEPTGFGVVVAARDHGLLSDADFYDLLTRLENL
jgi:hypothetical protein